MKIKFPERKKKFKKEGFVIYPSFYWKILLSVSFMLMLVSFLFSYFIYLKINKEVELSSQELDSQVETIKKDRILGVLKYFEERNEKSKEILSSPSVVIDPSL